MTNSRGKVTLDEEIVRRASEVEKIGLKALDALHLACAERAADVMLTIDDEIVERFKSNKRLIRIKVENPVKWLAEVIGSE